MKEREAKEREAKKMAKKYKEGKGKNDPRSEEEIITAIMKVVEKEERERGKREEKKRRMKYKGQMEGTAVAAVDEKRAPSEIPINIPFLSSSHSSSPSSALSPTSSWRVSDVILSFLGPSLGRKSRRTTSDFGSTHPNPMNRETMLKETLPLALKEYESFGMCPPLPTKVPVIPMPRE